MDPATVPLTWSTSLTSWRWDSATALLIAVGCVAYGWAWRRADVVTLRSVWCFVGGVVLAIAATMSRPVTVLRGALGPAGRARLDRLLATRGARFVAHPTTTSVAMLGTPWLLYLTPWYVAALTHSDVPAATRMLLVLIGFGYFYARLQTDPVPRRYSQLISLVISIVESIGDGQLDNASEDFAATTALWWENDPQLRDRMGRR
jgi:hypothetical protein